jgi:hypothetical protein
MLGKRVPSGIEFDLAGLPVVTCDQPAIIVEQHLFGNPAEVSKRALDTGKPTLLPLVAERPDMEPLRVAQRGHKQVHLYILAADRHPALAEIDLQLLARRCLKANRRPRFRLQFPAQVRHRPFDSPQGQPNPLLLLQLLANHIGIARMTAETFAYPILKTSQGPRTATAAMRQPAAGRQIPAHRHMAAPQLARDPPNTPPQRLQPQHRCDLLRRLHHLSPR